MSLRCPCCQLGFILYKDWLDHYRGTAVWKGCRYYADHDQCSWCAMKDPKFARPGPFGKSFDVTGTPLCWACFNELDDCGQFWYIESWRNAKFFFGTAQAYADYQNYWWAYKKWWLSKGGDLSTFDYCGAKDFRNKNALLKMGFPFTKEELAKLDADARADKQAIIDEMNAQVEEFKDRENQEKSKMEGFLDAETKSAKESAKESEQSKVTTAHISLKKEK